MPGVPVDALERARRFVDLHAGDELFVMANPTTTGIAQLLERLGYQALGTSSAALARSLGRKDGENALTRVEAIEHAKDLAAATNVPISGDFENGYGDDPAAVAETISASIQAGLAGCCIEDATGQADEPIYDAKLAAERIAAGAEAMGDSPFVLVARAENFLHGRADLEDTISRLQAFEAAGASAVYAPGLTTLAQVNAIVSSVGIPVNALVGVAGQRFSLEDLAEAGVRRVSVGSGFERVANAALKRVAEQLLDTRAPLGPMFNG
jgi:2-methylisocitrate lyase-like PEP mutase family enzyme